jgi:hypothetical protein
MAKTRLPPERESKIQSSIRVRLRRLGIKLFRRNVGAMREGERFIRFSTPGQSDLWGWDIRTGRHWEIEVKRPGNRPTPKQLEWLKECHRYGAVAYWADSANIAERVAQAIQSGGRIAWHDDDNFDVEDCRCP